MGRLDAVRITVGLTRYDADRAASAFGLIPDGSESAVYFCEYLGAAGHDLPLYDRGVILRLSEIGPDAQTDLRVGDRVNKRLKERDKTTKGKYSDKIKGGVDKAKNALDGLDGKNDDIKD